MSNEFEAVRDKLNSVGPGFCLAKWYQVTIHLQNGMTHSCHHPYTHKVSLEELKNDSSALHNTNLKKSLRKEMLNGHRPKECQFCWKTEDSHPDNLSDRYFKSNEFIDKFDETLKLPWDESVSPTYVEVSFGNECNFKCAYCAPHISSGLMSEYQTSGHYKTIPEWNLDKLKKDGHYPISKNEENPYIDAFWKWWPEVSKGLKTFRITGGEPLINSNTFKFLDELLLRPYPDLELAINSNLDIPEVFFEKFLQKMEYILENNLIKSFTLYTSLDTHGKNGEFIRFGMKYENVIKNCETFLKRIPKAQLSFMTTYNAFSVINFDKYLHDVLEFKRRFRHRDGSRRVLLDIVLLRNPPFLSVFVLPKSFLTYVQRDIDFMKEHPDLFFLEELAKMERIYSGIVSGQYESKQDAMRGTLYLFLQEYQEKKKIRFLDYCPEYKKFYDLCKMGYFIHFPQQDQDKK
jgi:organic radical activating enzyme